MSRLVTQLVAENPAIILVGENTILRDKLGKSLLEKGVNIIYVSPKEIEKNITVLQNAYKVIWVVKNSEESLLYLHSLTKITTPLLIVFPVLQTISSHQTDLLSSWVEESEKQFQFIVDCNYYLPTASFIFGLDIIGNNEDISSVNHILSHIGKSIIIDPSNQFNFLSVDDFIFQVNEHVFIPRNQTSVLIKGKSVDSARFISLIKKLYDAYHNTNLEVVRDIVTFEKVIPFSLNEKVLSTDTKTIATYLVKRLSSPKKIVSEKIIPSPRSFNEEKTGEISQNILKINIQPTEIKKSVIEPTVELPKKMKISESNELAPVKKTTEETDFNKEIQRIFKTTRTDKKVERVEKIVKSTKKITKKSKHKTFLFYGGLLSIGMSVGMIILATTYFLSGSILKKQLVAILTQTAQTKELFSTNPSSFFEKTTTFVAKQTNIYGKIIEGNLISKNSVLVDLGFQFLKLPQILSEADKASKNLVLQILNGNVGQTTQLAEILTQKASEAYENLSLMQATLEQADLGEYSQEQLNFVERFENELKTIRSGLAIQQQLQQILPSLVGIEEKRTYALLLQNNQELRPTGGFIQAVALVNFDNGSLVSYKVYSVYDLDKKLPGKVVAPDDIKLHLGEQNWFLRDSNWDPDFPTTSKQVAWFIEKSLGVNIDGVIGLNIFSLRDLLESTGPIELPEYNEVITARNIEERMEFHSEVVLVNSPDSVDYSVKIMNEVLNKLVILNEESVPSLLSSLNNSFETKQTQITSFKTSEQSILTSLGWTGGTTIPSCPARLSTADCVVDIMAQAEANIGVNKSNYYLDRTINHQINLSRTSAQHSRTIVYKNNAKSNSWPKGTYKSYQRFFVNKNAVVQKVLINGSPLSPQQIVEEVTGDFKIIGIRVDVPIQKQIIVDLVYSTPISSSDSFSYVFYNKKQSGLDNDPFTISITHTPDLKPVLIAPSASISENSINFNSQFIDEASLFGVKFEY